MSAGRYVMVDATTTNEGEREVSETVYCDRCGEPLSGHGHEACQAARELEPPRYCVQCGRRMVVQVTPGGWSSRCARHGPTLSTG